MEDREPRGTLFYFHHTADFIVLKRLAAGHRYMADIPHHFWTTDVLFIMVAIFLSERIHPLTLQVRNV